MRRKICEVGALVVAALVGLGSVGCVVHTDQSREWIRESASKDLVCPKGQLTVTHYMGKRDTKKAEGCGKHAIYQEVCEGSQCRWERVP